MGEERIKENLRHLYYLENYNKVLRLQNNLKNQKNQKDMNINFLKTTNGKRRQRTDYKKKTTQIVQEDEQVNKSKK